MDKKLWKKFRNENIAINCKTEDEAKKFLKACDIEGLKWASKENATSHSNWSKFKEMTCYTNDFPPTEGISFARRAFSISKGYEVIIYAELIGGKQAFTNTENSQLSLF